MRNPYEKAHNEQLTREQWKDTVRLNAKKTGNIAIFQNVSDVDKSILDEYDLAYSDTLVFFDEVTSGGLAGYCDEELCVLWEDGIRHSWRRKMTETALTNENLADALDCFWNGALGAERNGLSVAACMAQGFTDVAIRLKETAKAPREEILKQILTNPRDGMRIGFDDGEWILSCNSGVTFAEIARHEDWNSFLDLCGELT